MTEQLAFDTARPCDRADCTEPATDIVRWGAWLKVVAHLCHSCALESKRKPR